MLTPSPLHHRKPNVSVCPYGTSPCLRKSTPDNPSLIIPGLSLCFHISWSNYVLTGVCLLCLFTAVYYLLLSSRCPCHPTQCVHRRPMSAHIHTHTHNTSQPTTEPLASQKQFKEHPVEQYPVHTMRSNNGPPIKELLVEWHRAHEGLFPTEKTHVMFHF